MSMRVDANQRSGRSGATDSGKDTGSSQSRPSDKMLIPSTGLRGSKTALLEAAQAAVADQRDKSKTGPSNRLGSDRAVFRGLFGLMTLAAALLLFLQPPWLAGPKLPTETPEIRAASATLGLVEAASHIRDYQKVTGRLPFQLKDAGIENSAIRYQRVDPSDWILTVSVDNSIVTIKSTDAIRPIATQAIRTLQGRT